MNNPFWIPQPDVYKPAWILERMAVSSLQPAPCGTGRAYRVLFTPSFDPEVCITAEEARAEVRITLVSMLTNLWMYGTRPLADIVAGVPLDRRVPARWERCADVRLDADATAALRRLAEAAMREPPGDLGKYITVDGMATWKWHRDGGGVVHELARVNATRPKASRHELGEMLHALARAAFDDETSADLLTRIRKYMD